MAIAPNAVAASDAANDDGLLRRSNAAELYALLRERPRGGMSAAEALACLRVIAGEKPALALELAQAVGRDDEEKVAWTTELARSWASRDRHRAWEWLAQQGERLEKFGDGSLLTVMLDEIAAIDPGMIVANADARLRLDDEPGGIASQVLAQISVQALIKNGGIEAARGMIEVWARDSASLDAGIGAYSAIASELAIESVETAAEWLRSLPISESRNVALTEIAANWVNRDPAAAMAWSGALKPEEGRAEVVRRAFSDWLERDPLKAGDWLGEHVAAVPAGPETDNLIVNLIHQSALTKLDPTGAMKWAELMADAEARAHVQDRVLLRWSSRDFETAVRYVMVAGSITPDRREVLLEKMRAARNLPESAEVWFAADAFGTND